MKNKVKINVKNEKLDVEDLKKVKDGPGVADIKQKKGKSPEIKKKKSSRIIKIKEKIRRNTTKKTVEKKQTENYESPRKFKLYYLLIILFCLIIAVISYFTYIILQKDKIIKIIPENVVMYGRIDYQQLNKEYDKGAVGSFIANFSAKEDFKKMAASYINQELTNQYGLNFIDDISPIISQEIAFSSFLTSEENIEKLSHILIIETKDINQADKVIKQSLGLKSVKSEYFAETAINYAMFEEEKLNFYYTFIDNFLVLGKNQESLEKIIDVAKQKKASLAHNQNFIKTVFYHIRLKNNYLYFNLEDISLAKIPELQILGYKNKDLAPFYLFLKKLGHTSFYLEARNNNLNLHGFSLAKEKNSNSVKISNLVPINTLGVFSSYNLDSEINNYLNILEEEDKNRFTQYKNLEQKIVTEYNINLEEDIYSLLEKGSEIIIYPQNDNYDLAFAINSGSQEKEKLSAEKLERAISHHFGLLNPQEKKFNLADGSEATEYYSSEDEFSFTDINIKNYKAKTIENSKARSYSYALLDQKLIFSTSRDLLEKIITAKQDKNGLIYSAEFEDLKSYNKGDNSLIYMDISKVFDKMGISEKNGLYKLKKLIIKSSNNYFGTGIKGYLLVK